MKIRRFFGKDMREALSQVKAELGSDAVIMSNRKVADGIELVAAYDKEPEAKLNISKTPSKGAAKSATPSLSEIIGDDGPDMPVMELVGFAVAVNDAHPLIKRLAHYTTQMLGGFGAVRELTDLLMLENNKPLTTKGTSS